MKKLFKRSLFVPVLLLIISFSFKIEGQNLMKGWDGNGITGTGSEPSKFGWISEGVTFATAGSDQRNQCVYRDYEGNRYIISGLTKSFYYPVNLKKDVIYNLAALFTYFDYGDITQSVPFFISDKENKTIATTTVKKVTHVSKGLVEGKLSFTVPEDGQYYVSYSNIIAYARLAVTGFSLTENNFGLSALEPSAGILKPAFSPLLFNYKLIVPNTINQVSLNPKAVLPNVIQSGSEVVDLTSGNENVRICVKDGHNNENYYFVQIVKENHLLDLNNILWNSQSLNSSQSMPLVGGDLGCNVWVENGDLMLYLQRSGSFDENGEYLKLGRLRIHLDPNPFAEGAFFAQELKLRNGNIEIEGKGDVHAKINLWVDVYTSNLHIDIESAENCSAQARYESWRTEDKSIGGSGDPQRDGVFGLLCYKDELIRHKDNFLPQENSLIFYHRNGDEATFPKTSIELLGFESFKDNIYDDIHNRTFGGCIYGDHFKMSNEVETGVYQETPYTGWSLISTESSKEHHITLVSLIEQTNTSDEWLSHLQTKVEQSKTSIAQAQANTLQWWNQYWDRSYIIIDPLNPYESNLPWQIARNYQLFRYQLGGNAFGEYPTKFNGGNLTFDSKFVNSNKNYGPDFRRWGGEFFTAQNQRLIYWPLLKSGDFESMKPQFDLFKKGLYAAKKRVSTFFGHEGALYSEYISASGLPGGDMWGWNYSSGSRLRGQEIPFCDPRADGDVNYNSLVEKGVQANQNVGYLWTAQLEMAYMMLEYHRFSSKSIMEYMPFIEESLIFFNEHYRLRQKNRNGQELDDQGKLVVYPSTGAETYRGAKNPTDVLAGLKACLTDLLQLDDSYFSIKDKAYYQSFLNSIPDLSYKVEDGVKRILPAESWKCIRNIESTQFYPLFPYNVYNLTNPEIEYFKNSSFHTISVDGWMQCGIEYARMGQTEKAVNYNLAKLKNSPCRFPSFWGPGYDWTPDHNWGGTGMIGLQEMLIQTFGDSIYLFPTWPKEWDVNFKMHAPGNTTITGKLKDGILQELNVDPIERLPFVRNLLPSVSTDFPELKTNTQQDRFLPSLIHSDDLVKISSTILRDENNVNLSFYSIDGLTCFDMKDLKYPFEFKGPHSPGIYIVFLQRKHGSNLKQKIIVK